MTAASIRLTPTFPTISEGNSGTRQLAMTATLSNAVTTAVTVDYYTTNGDAIAGLDYTAAKGTLSFAPGETVKTFNVTILGDTAYESDENFFVKLENPSGNAVLAENGGATAIVTIPNDDSATAPVIKLVPAFPSIVEGDTGSKMLTMTAILSTAATTPVTVDYQTSDGFALAGQDYVAANGTLTFAPGDISKTFNVSVLGDSIYESEESFFIKLSNPVGAVLAENGGASAIAGIIDNDSPTLPTIRLTPAFPSIVEGDSGIQYLTITATLSSSSATSVLVNYETSDGFAQAGTDYLSTRDFLFFMPGETTKTFKVGILGDKSYESDESFFIKLFSASGALIAENGGGSLIATITNDDVPYVDLQGPVILGSSPASGAVDIAPDTDIVLTFDEAIQRGSGSLKLIDKLNTVVETFDMATSAAVTITGTTLRINPTADLSNNNYYRLEYPAGAIRDMANNGIERSGAYSFSTKVVPVLDSIAVTPSLSGDNMIMTLTASKWSWASNWVSFTLTYDSSLISYDKWTGISGGSSAFAGSTSVSEIGNKGTLTFNGNINNFGTTSSFLQLTFKQVESKGNLTYGISNGLLNGAQVSSVNGIYEYAKAVILTGTNGPDKLAGDVGNDILTGGLGNDVLTGGKGNDFLTGDAGTDTAAYAGLRSAYTFTEERNGTRTVSGPEGTDTLKSIERLKFSDGILALDIDGAAGQAYRIYQAAFNRAPDAKGLSFWIDVMDHGVTLRDVAGGFVSSPEFQSLYGTNPSNASIVDKLYENVLHRAPEAAGRDFWLGILDNKLASVAEVLMSFSESPENRAALVGVIGQGFMFDL